MRTPVAKIGRDAHPANLDAYRTELGQRFVASREAMIQYLDADGRVKRVNYRGIYLNISIH